MITFSSNWGTSCKHSIKNFKNESSKETLKEQKKKKNYESTVQ